MTVRDKSALSTNLGALLVNNTAGSIEADELLQQFIDVLDSYGNTSAVPSGVVPMRGPTDGVLEPSSMNEDSDFVHVEKSCIFLPAEVRVGDASIRFADPLISFRSNRTDRDFLAIGVPYTDAGTGDGMRIRFAPSETMPAAAQQTATDSTLSLTAGETHTFLQPGAVGVDHVLSSFIVRAQAAATIRLELFVGNDATGNAVLDMSVDVGSTDTTITTDSLVRVVAGQNYFSRITAITDVVLVGTGSGVNFIPRYIPSGWPYSEITVVDSDNISDHINPVIVAGEGISKAFDSNANTVTLSLTQQVNVALTGFSIDIPARVDLNTDLNVAQTIRFRTDNVAEITSLTLVNTQGDDIALTIPANDGTHTQTVTLTGIDSSTEKTAMFSLRGETSGGDTITSNSDSVSIRDQVPDEFAYWWVNPTNNANEVDLSTTTSVDVTPPDTMYNILTSLPASNLLLILEPADRPITSILETTFNQEALSTFTLTNNARTINGQAYNLYALTNNGPTGTISFRVTHG